MRMRLALLILLLLPLPAHAALVRDGAAAVVAIVDGDTLMLETGREVRLVGLQAPKLPLGRRNFQPWPLAEEAKAALAELALNRRLTLSYGGARQDRHGRLLAHLHRAEDGLWIQGEMLRRGLARVYSFPDNRALVAEMLALEREARAAERGIWGQPYYRVLDHGEAGQFIDSFQLVEGRVVAAERRGNRAYLNFDQDWRSDFTVTLDNRALGLFERAGVDPIALSGKKIRIRGWLKSFNGPAIEATHPEQIEVLQE
ncbi:thermonuclease family protein [Oceanibaculum pacificum]|uniref:Nuclease (SNase) n=1 Tax=Oceanibaculum pacificum TaxID=580166 RepID=A0A154W6M5_9PROT|nr:thermonuclease family protein [Oceanibaculum pacificum]KZD09101.1 nuclease (SNase) [Oceanibaculum pacificum]